jgi:hypothetical protein
MTAEHVASTIKQALTDPQLAQQITDNPDQALGSLNLSDEERNIVLQVVREALDTQVVYAQKKFRDRLDADAERAINLGAFTLQIFKDTLSNAKKTYSLINVMNSVKFSLGVLLFAASALFGAFSSDKRAAAILGGLGAATFITIFLLGPIKRSQNALSNLVQVQISFMNFFDQITYWSNYALTTDGTAPPPILVRVEKASEVLQLRSQETIQLLQSFVEQDDKKP